jgi:hypothetical protein
MTKCSADPYFSTPLVFSPVFIDELSKFNSKTWVGWQWSSSFSGGWLIILRSAVELDLLIENMHTVVNSANTASRLREKGQS